MTIDSPRGYSQPASFPDQTPVPNPPVPNPPVPNPPERRGGITLAALIVGISAFVTGWIPVLGLLLGITGIVLGILALRKHGRKGFGLMGLIGSALALLTNVLVISVIVISLVSSGIGTSILNDAQPIITPCYSFNGPADYINNQSAEKTEGCITSQELWGEYDADGEINNTGVGSILGSVLVEPVRVASTDEWAPSGSLDDMVDFLNESYFPDAGEVTSLKEAVSLDGVDANLTRLTSTAEKTKTKAFLTVFAPNTYQFAGEPVKFFVISFVIPADNGEEIIAAAVDSWRWRQG
ncbi:MAG: SirB2 family protein [Cryobacterium sp.]|uniref:DUF4190 domain-containing protein n=1 Tax=unclassified Cryobacterium TaxID=2649013 RepID=UPI0018CA2886|nr:MULTISPECIES: DUF4190 domain-containing protein [unclassified Cryobacterium]MCY7405283.1 SirB2 family protein [Cryobacterium sp.]MEC5156011.1 hypothetical protein [Cryobacterium sp. CAN_C3]